MQKNRNLPNKNYVSDMENFLMNLINKSLDMLFLPVSERLVYVGNVRMTPIARTLISHVACLRRLFAASVEPLQTVLVNDFQQESSLTFAVLTVTVMLEKEDNDL